MNNQQLSAFCDVTRHNIEKPFSFGPYSYATNGHLIFRVPRADDVPEWDALNEHAQALFDRVDMAAAEAALIEIPALPEVKTSSCGECRGRGRVNECPECDGKGEVTLENDFSTYDGITCATCNGRAVIPGDGKSCSACRGTGEKVFHERFALGPSGFSVRYLSILRALPGIRIAPIDPKAAAYFRFDGGDGLLLPMMVIS